MRSQESIMKDSRIWGIKIVGSTMFGGFVKLKDCGTCSVIWSDREEGHEHVSVSPRKQANIPTWEDMCQLKDIFFDGEEEVYQIHPPKSQYVNIRNNCLHLWRPCSGKRISDLV